mmetsp:Transcript_11570/g.22424  ORF Transcript_11570/g.22424 Transcript_11570/m.22424 type:complete len:264 (+) Transcript_11570:294-1085(+)
MGGPTTDPSRRCPPSSRARTPIATTPQRTTTVPPGRERVEMKKWKWSRRRGPRRRSRPRPRPRPRWKVRSRPRKTPRMLPPPRRRRQRARSQSRSRRANITPCAWDTSVAPLARRLAEKVNRAPPEMEGAETRPPWRRGGRWMLPQRERWMERRREPTGKERRRPENRTAWRLRSLRRRLRQSFDRRFFFVGRMSSSLSNFKNSNIPSETKKEFWRTAVPAKTLELVRVQASLQRKRTMAMTAVETTREARQRRLFPSTRMLP